MFYFSFLHLKFKQKTFRLTVSAKDCMYLGCAYAHWDPILYYVWFRTSWVRGVLEKPTAGGNVHWCSHIRKNRPDWTAWYSFNLHSEKSSRHIMCSYSFMKWRWSLRKSLMTVTIHLYNSDGVFSTYRSWECRYSQQQILNIFHSALGICMPYRIIYFAGCFCLCCNHMDVLFTQKGGKSWELAGMLGPLILDTIPSFFIVWIDFSYLLKVAIDVIL